MAKDSNPFIADRPVDTIHQAKCAVDFIRETMIDMHEDTLSENAAFGFHLILDGVVSALDHAKAQVTALAKR